MGHVVIIFVCNSRPAFDALAQYATSKRFDFTMVLIFSSLYALEEEKKKNRADGVIPTNYHSKKWVRVV